MVDSLKDGQVRQIYDEINDRRYKVTIPADWVQTHPDNYMRLSEQWVWGEIYKDSPPDMPELPDDIKAQFGLVAPPIPPPAHDQGDVRGRDDEQQHQRRRMGGKSKKRPTARRRRSSKARKARKARATRRK